MLLLDKMTDLLIWLYRLHQQIALLLKHRSFNLVGMVWFIADPKNQVMVHFMKKSTGYL